jgi:sulfotransferase
MNKDIVFLSGLPRTGSTLLTSILSQNTDIHTEGNSALCQLMWDMQVSCEQTEQMLNRPELQDKLISKLPNIFYEDINGPAIDKCRSWTLPANLELIDRYITKTPKIIVMTRPVVEIVKSFVFIRKMNGWLDPEAGLLDDGSEPIMRSLNGVNYARQINNGQFLFVEYQDLLDNTDITLNRIYEFCGWNKFKHNLKDIKNLAFEKDEAINLVGLHDIRPTISKRKIDIELSEKLYQKAISLG